jgi:hypothetical protein
MNDDEPQSYEIVYYDGSADPPVYYLIGEVEGESPEQALRSNLQNLATEVRHLLFLELEYYPDKRIYRSLFAIRSDGLVPAWNLESDK